MSNQQAIRDVGKNIDKGLDKIAEAASRGGVSLDQLIDALREATGATPGAATGFGAVATSIEAMAKAMSKFNKETKGPSASGLKSIQESINGLKSFEFRTSGNKKMSGGIQQLNKDLTSTVSKLDKVIAKVEELSKWMSKVNSDKGFNVNINNKGFSSVIKAAEEMNKAITNFNSRAGNERKNFFDVAFGTKGDNQKSANEMVKDAKNAIKEARDTVGEDLGKTLKNQVQKAIKEGLSAGIKEGIKNVNVSGTDAMTTFLGEYAAKTKLSQSQKGDIIDKIFRMNGAEIDPWLIKNRELELASQEKRSNYKIDKVAETKINLKNAELDRLITANPEDAKKATEAIVKEREALAKIAENKLKNQLDADKRGKQARKQYQEDVKRFEEEFAQYQGRELTNYDKIRMKLAGMVERYDELKLKAENNMYNQSQLYQVMQQITKATRQYAEEVYKAAKGYDAIKEKAQKTHKVLTSLASGFQRTSAFIGSFGQIFSTLRAQAKSLFGYLTNSVRRLSYTIRSQLNSAISSGVEQFKSMEAARISFEQFFGEDRANNVIAEVRKQALETPIVTSGELADYVSQLAPVSNGNASLAINASLGALKAIAASGSSTADMEYVIKNIRDVISKGKATAIDIRQFNRAMPALEKFIDKMGLNEFLTDDGDQKNLSITSENVGRVLDMFAHLNTDEDSPIKDINEKQLETLEGMLKLMDERKTTMVETVLTKSGVFDLAKQILQGASGDKFWSDMEKFFTKHVSKVVNFIKQVDWNKIGAELSNGMEKISAAVKNAWKEIKQVAGISESVVNDDATVSVLSKIWDIIISFINGFKDGIKQAVGAFNVLKSIVGEDTMIALANSIGYLVSPMGKIINTGLSLARDFTGGFSRILATMDSITKARYSAKLKSIEKAAGKYADKVTTVGINGARSLINANREVGYIYGDKIVQGGMVYSEGTRSRIRNSKGAYSSWDNLGVVDKAKTVGPWNYIKTTATSGLKSIFSFAMSLLKGLGAAFLASGLIDAATAAGKNMKLFGDSTEGVMNTFNVLAKTVSGAVIGAMIGGTAGGLVGAIGMAVIALNGLYQDWKKNKAEEQEAELSTKLDEAHQTQFDAIIQAMQEAGIDTNLGSDEGFYAGQKLKQYINSFDDPGMVSYDKAEEVFLDAIRYKQTAQALYNYANSDEYNNLGGRVLDLDKDQDYRDRMAKMIKWFRANGDNYNYDNNSPEQILKTWLNGDTIADKQAEAMLNKWGELDVTVAEKTTDLKGSIDNETGVMRECKDKIGAVTMSIDQLKASIDSLNNGDSIFSDLIQSTMDYDKITQKGTYQFNGKTYGIADVWQYVNRKIEALDKEYLDIKDTDPERAKQIQEQINWLAHYNYASMSGYQNDKNFNAGDWFRMLAADESPYSEDFRGFMDTNGIEGDIKNYMQKLNKHLFSGEASWFQTYVKLHGEVGLNAAMSNAEKILSISGINEETKQKIQELSREKAFETLNYLYKEAQKVSPSTLVATVVVAEEVVGGTTVVTSSRSIVLWAVLLVG